jgi:hypothetical protein
LLERQGDTFFLLEALLVLANVALRRGDRPRAGELSMRVMEGYRAINDAHGMANALQVQAWLALGDPLSADAATAAALYEQSWTLRSSVQRVLSPHEQSEYARLRAAIGAL